MITEIRLHIDDSIFLSLKEEKETFTKDMLFEYALRLYRKHKLSLGKAAELAGYTRLEFIQKLQVEQEPIFDYDAAMIDEMITSANTTPHVCQESQR
jgi:predicted HTH domain antitoxin